MFIATVSFLDNHFTAGAAAALTPSATPCAEVAVQNDPTSTTDIYVGSANTQSWRLAPGGAIVIGIDDASKVYTVAVSGSPRVNWQSSSLFGALRPSSLGDASTISGNVSVVGNVADGAADSGNPVKVGGVFKTTPTVLTNGQRGDMTLDVNENLRVTLGTLISGEYQAENALAILEQCIATANFGPTQYTNWGTVTKANIKATPGNVYGLIIFNGNATIRYAQLHNKATAPAGADVPLQSWPIPAGTANAPGFLIIDRQYFQAFRYSTGIGWAVSTTQSTFTDAATASDHSIELLYK